MENRHAPTLKPAQSPTDTWQWEYAAMVYVYAKLTLAVAGMITYYAVLSPHLELLQILGAAILIDTLFLFFLYRSVKHGERAATIAVHISAAFGVVTITLGVHFAGGFISPLIAGYFVLMLLVCVVMPRARAIGAVTGMSTLAYLALVGAEVSELAPAIGHPRLREEQNWLGFAALVVSGFWIAALFVSRFAATVEQRRRKHKELYAQAQRRAEAESVWDTVGKSLVSTQNLDKVLTTVIQVLNEKMQVETGSVILREPDTDEIMFAKILCGKTATLESVRLKVGQGIAGWVVSTGQSALVNDVKQDPRWYPQIDQTTGFETRSLLAVPLIVTEGVIGAIELVNKRGGSFTRDDLRLLESIAGPVAIAIQNARLHQRVLDQLDDLSRLFHKVEHAKKEWETFADAIDEGVIIIDPHCRILRINRTLANWLNTTSAEMVGKTCYRVMHGTSSKPAFCSHSYITNGHDSTREIEVEQPHLGGTFRMKSYALRADDGTVIGAVTVLKNITAEKRYQAQLIQSEKMTTVGRLAASLAHEINNPLQALQGCLDLAQTNPVDAPKQQRYLAMATNELDRLATMVQRMLDFYRPTKWIRTRIKIPALIEDVLTLSAKRLQHARVVVRTEWDADLPMIEGVANQLKQVFLNLVLNAVDAMPDGGRLEIRGRISPKDAQWIAVEFADTGVGIAPEQLKDIFEPFFTTKSTGTGLGLGISHSIIASHGGEITVASAVGTGSAFTVLLPGEALTGENIKRFEAHSVQA